MALPQDIRPVNSELADSITRSSEIPWIETKPGQAWTKVLWRRIPLSRGSRDLPLSLTGKVLNYPVVPVPQRGQ